MKKILYYVIKTINIAITAALVLVCVFSGYLLYCNTTDMEVPKLGPFKIYVVLTDSMFPVMRTDDAIIIKAADADSLNAGDIITFYAFESNQVITHRITDRNQTAEGYEFNTKGDNNNTPDGFITPADRIIGKYILKIPQFGRFIKVTSENVFMLIIPAAVLMAVQFLSGTLENRLRPEKKERTVTEADNIIRSIYENSLKSRVDFNEPAEKGEDIKYAEEPEQKEENNT